MLEEKRLEKVELTDKDLSKVAGGYGTDKYDGRGTDKNNDKYDGHNKEDNQNKKCKY